MPSINLNKLISVTSATMSSGYTPASLVANVLSKNSLIPVNDKQRSLNFTSPDLVGDFFGYESDEYLYATQYFKGYSSQLGTAPFITFSRYISEDVGAYISSGGIVSGGILSDIVKITAGAITFQFNGTKQVLKDLDFSKCTSLSMVANVIQTALDALIKGVLVTYNGMRKEFYITIPAGKGDTLVDYCLDSPLALLLKLTQVDNAILSQGSKAQTPAENMAAIKKISRNWQAFNTLWDNFLDKAETLALCKWNDSNNQERTVFAVWTKTTVGNSISLKQDIDENLYANIFVNYSDYDFIAGELGSLAAIDYNQRSATISLANKTFTGIKPLVDNDLDYDLLTAAKVNFYGQFSSRATIYNFSEDGSVTGPWNYIENIYNEAWLDDTLQNKTAVFFSVTKRNPYNNYGYESLGSVVNDVLQQATKNNVAEAGVNLSQIQIQSLSREAGFDISSALFDQGYYYQVVPATAEQRAKRDPIVVNIWYINGGNWNKVKFQNRYVQ